MRKIVYFIWIAGLVAMFASCASVNKEVLANVKNAALLSVNCDRTIDMSDFGTLAALAQTLSKSADFDLQPIVNSLRDDVLNEWVPLFPFDVMPESEVLAHPDYVAKVQSQGPVAKVFAVPQSYAHVDILDTNATKKLASALNSGAGIIVQARYSLSKSGGASSWFGVARIECSLWLVVKDSSGKDVLSRLDLSSSDTNVGYALDFVPDSKQLLIMCREATVKAGKSMTKWLKTALK
jgi:hypothetical protein